MKNSEPTRNATASKARPTKKEAGHLAMEEVAILAWRIAVHLAMKGTGHYTMKEADRLTKKGTIDPKKINFTKNVADSVKIANATNGNVQ